MPVDMSRPPTKFMIPAVIMAEAIALTMAMVMVGTEAMERARSAAQVSPMR